MRIEVNEATLPRIPFEVDELNSVKLVGFDALCNFFEKSVYQVSKPGYRNRNDLTREFLKKSITLLDDSLIPVYM